MSQAPRRATVVAALVSTLLIALLMAALVPAAGAAPAGPPDEVVPDHYILVLKDGAGDPDAIGQDLARRHGLSVGHVYRAALRGFSAVIPANRLGAVQSDPRVAFVSPDRVVRALPGAAGKPSGGAATQPAQTIPTGISRVGLNSANRGTGIGVAVIDTGIDLKHPDLAANIAGNVTFVTGTKNGNDDNGHGSHVAGTIGALDNAIGVRGVAPEVRLYAVKVLSRSGSGTWSGVIAGVDWVTQRADTIKVANMSLGGGGSSDGNCGYTNGDALHTAICGSVAAGVTYVVAAGNAGTDAASSVPASYPEVITVSALADCNGESGGSLCTTSYGADDTFATFSNYSGSIVDIGAPGVSIFSTYKGSGYATLSGTSMATPHVAGAAALAIKTYLSANGAYPSPDLVRAALVGSAEPLGAGHTDPSGLHPEPVVLAGGL
ncbi:MAG: S8 family serine peptidase [Chloroflexi bacterium]|nr:S8 family serine peptidase [Chloroflexota bacterium]